MNVQEATKYFQKLFSLWLNVSEAYASNDAEATRRFSEEIDRIQLNNWRTSPDGKANSH